MMWLRVATRLVLVQLMLLALSLLGLVLAGTAPAATAAARVVGPVRRDESLPIMGTMWRTWRECFVRSNLAAAPAGALALVAGANLLLLGAGPMALTPAAGGAPWAGTALPVGLVGTVSVAILVIASLAWLVAVVMAVDPALSAGEILRAAVLFPIAFPGTALSLLVTLGAVVLIAAVVPPAAALWGGAAAVLVTDLMVTTRRRLLTEHLATA